MSVAPDSSSRSVPSKATNDPLVGTTLDRYLLDKLIGEGGMGRVYSALHTVTRRRCALKLLPDDLCKQPDFLSRFRAEAQTLARLDHPNIVKIYSGGEAQSRFFLEMELIDGGDLQKHVTEHAAKTGTGLPEAEVQRITQGILAALEYAHKEGVIHRDLKPANVLLSNKGSVKVSDFGLATVIGENFSRSRLETSLRTFSLSKVTSMETSPPMPISGSGSFAGTILYMSPQALKGDDPDPRDDLFALGVSIYFMLVGRTPVLNYKPISRQRKGLIIDWDKFIGICLAEDRDARFANATAAREFLENRSRKSRGVLIAGIAAAILVVAAGAGLIEKFKSPPPPLAATAVKEAQAIEFDPLADVRGNVPPFALNARSSSGLPVQFQLVGGNATINGSMLAVTGVGAVTIRALQPGDERHAAAPPVERTFTVLPVPSPDRTVVVAPPAAPIVPERTIAVDPPAVTAAPERTVAVAPSSTPPPADRKFQSITIEPIRNRPIGSSTFEVVARSSSDLPVSVSVVSGPATVRGNTLTLTGSGSVTLRYSQGGNEKFLPANTVDRTFAIEEPKKVEAPMVAKVAETPLSIAPPMISPVVGNDYFLRFCLYHERNKHPTTNYARGTLVPINTPVKLVSMTGELMVLRRVDTREELQIENVEKFSKRSLTEIAQLMLSSEKTPLEKLSGALANSIRSGQVVRGMTKEQVLMARGYPPAHETPSLDGDRWTYWSSRFVKRTLVFADGRLSEGRGLD